MSQLFHNLLFDSVFLFWAIEVNVICLFFDRRIHCCVSFAGMAQRWRMLQDNCIQMRLIQAELFLLIIVAWLVWPWVCTSCLKYIAVMEPLKTCVNSWVIVRDCAGFPPIHDSVHSIFMGCGVVWWGEGGFKRYVFSYAIQGSHSLWKFRKNGISF